jgi:TolA-binding protein
MDSKLKDMLELVKTLNAPPPAPAPVTPQGTASGAPAGWVPSVAYNTARSDYGGGRFDLAIQGFADYVKFAPKDDENAPNAQYYIGMSYYNLKQYDSAAQAFGDVLDKYQLNSKSCESRYMKARSLHEAKDKSGALSAYNEFLTACPADVNRPNAREYMSQLSGPARANTKGKGKAK